MLGRREERFLATGVTVCRGSDLVISPVVISEIFRLLLPHMELSPRSCAFSNRKGGIWLCNPDQTPSNCAQNSLAWLEFPFDRVAQRLEA